MGHDLLPQTHDTAQDSAIQALRQEVSVLRRQGSLMLRLMVATLNALRDLKKREDDIKRNIDVVENEIKEIQEHEAAPALCPSCGAPLEHHDADGGDLRVCPACGLSQFVDGSGMIRHTTLPVSLPADAPPVPHSWVEDAS